jgi:hypothetical protein
MIDRSPRLHARGSSLHIGTLLAAGFFILAGIVFQLAQFGYDGLAEKNLWFISMLATNAWSFLAANSDLPALSQFMRFWPMLLVAAGLALLAIPYSACARVSVSRVRITDRD